GCTPLVSSTKSFTGHVLGASTAIGLAESIVAMQQGLVPPTLNFEGPRPGCDVDCVPNEPRRAEIRNFLCNSAGFGGVNVVLAVGDAAAEWERPERRLGTVGISGIGILSAIGNGVEEFLQGLREQRCGIAEIDRFDTSDCRAK